MFVLVLCPKTCPCHPNFSLFVLLYEVENVYLRGGGCLPHIIFMNKDGICQILLTNISQGQNDESCPFGEGGR